jgi:hypothetical protein
VVSGNRRKLTDEPVEVLEEVQAICAGLPSDSTTSAAASSAPADDETAPSSSAPAGGDSSGVPTTAVSYPTTTMVVSTAKPTASSTYTGPTIVNGAGAAGPIVGLVVAAAALAL